MPENQAREAIGGGRFGLKQGSELINHKTDLSRILNQLHEIELLKKVLLTDDQYRMFNKLPKPNLLESMETKHRVEAEEKEMQEREEKLEEKGEAEEEPDEVQVLYDRLNSDRERTPLNDKLLAVLEEHVVDRRHRRRTDA